MCLQPTPPPPPSIYVSPPHPSFLFLLQGLQVNAATGEGLRGEWGTHKNPTQHLHNMCSHTRTTTLSQGAVLACCSLKFARVRPSAVPLWWVSQHALHTFAHTLTRFTHTFIHTCIPCTQHLHTKTYIEMMSLFLELPFPKALLTKRRANGIN